MAVIIVQPGETPVFGTLDDDSIVGTYASEAIYGRAGNDTILGHGGEDTLYGGLGNDLLISSERDGASSRSYLSGGAGDDTLVSTYGADTLLGGAGNDLISVERSIDFGVIRGGEGFDTLRVADFTRFAASDVTTIERVELVGKYAEDQAQVWMGEHQALRDDGSNRLEIASGGPDYDNVLVIGTVDGVMNASKLHLENWGAEDRLQLWGGEANDFIRGSAYGEEVLGFGGDDTLRGGLGDDGLAGGAGSDSLVGQQGNDRLEGGADGDVLAGGRGSDTLVGGEGADLFVFAAGFKHGEIDTVNDFVSADDRIALSASAFKGLALGALAEGAFRLGSVALDADDRILYDADTGALFFDRDGSGTRFEPQQFATLVGSPALGALDFEVI